MSAYEQWLPSTVLDVDARNNATGGFHPLRRTRLLISRVFVCWHRKLSRPFSHGGETYRVCLRCGMQRRFDLNEWKTKGDYYNSQVRGK